MAFKERQTVDVDQETMNITHEQALAKARAWETANLRAQDMSWESKSLDENVHFVKSSGQ